MAERLPFRMTLDEWRAQLDARTVQSPAAGDGLPDVAWRCPRCGATCNLQAAKDAGGNPELAPQQCIHRMLDDGECDWCAGGLFGTLNEGHILTAGDGHEIRVFSFADEPAGEEA